MICSVSIKMCETDAGWEIPEQNCSGLWWLSRPCSGPFIPVRYTPFLISCNKSTIYLNINKSVILIFDIMNGVESKRVHICIYRRDEGHGLSQVLAPSAFSPWHGPFVSVRMFAHLAWNSFISIYDIWNFKMLFWVISKHISDSHASRPRYHIITLPRQEPAYNHVSIYQQYMWWLICQAWGLWYATVWIVGNYLDPQSDPHLP